MKMNQDVFLSHLANLYRLPLPRKRKCITLFNESKNLPPDSTIVELGTYHGNGTFSLICGSLGKEFAIFTVDDYLEKKGWAGEKYGPDDKLIFENLRMQAKRDIPEFQLPGLLQGDIRTIGSTWDPDIYGRVDLLFWDTGVRDSCEGDLRIWIDNMSERGIVLCHDTGHQALGCERAMRSLGLWGIRLLDGGIWKAEVRRG